MRSIRIDEAVYTIFDVETTGLYPYSGDRICEIGAICMSVGSKKRERFHSLIDPKKPISEGAFAVNRITPDMVAGKPKIDGILPDFLKFIKGSVLVAYNAGFDLGFLECALDEDKKILNDYRVIDALSLARRLFPDIGRYNLASVAHSLGISSSQEHRAMSDAVMTCAIFEKELIRLASSGAETIDDIAQVQKRKAAKAATVKDYKLKLIEEAIRDQKRLNITYRSIWNNKITRRTITPKEVRKGYDSHYVVSHCHLKGEERTFRLDGILDATPEGKNGTRPF